MNSIDFEDEYEHDDEDDLNSLCMAAHDYGYSVKDFQEFVELVPSAITELAHWQNRGYALIIPQVMEKKYSIEEIR